MRDLLFKNLTSTDRKRRIIASSETAEKEGVRSIIHRHFICITKEIAGGPVKKPVRQVHILRKRDTRELTERFFCRVKGSVCVKINQQLFEVLFMHSLKITLSALSKEKEKEQV